MAECFCGCGRKVKFTRRNANSWGERVRDELVEWRELRAVLTEAGAGELLEFVDYGELAYAQLRASVHDERTQKVISRKQMLRWLDDSQRQMLTEAERIYRENRTSR
jgi:hypothetical protein